MIKLGGVDSDSLKLVLTVGGFRRMIDVRVDHVVRIYMQPTMFSYSSGGDVSLHKNFHDYVSIRYWKVEGTNLRFCRALGVYLGGFGLGRDKVHS